MTVGARGQALLDEGVAAGVFPSAAAVVLRDGRPVFEGSAGGATLRTVFDLASLTKIMATTAVFLALWRDGAVEPETPVGRFLPDTAAGRAGVTVADLLAHRAGLPAFVPLFAPILRATPELLDLDCPVRVRAAARAEAVTRALSVAPTAPPGTRYDYSDVGFVVLGETLGRAGERSLEPLVVERVARPLGLGMRFHRLSARDAWAPSAGGGAGSSRCLALARRGAPVRLTPPRGRRGSGSPSRRIRRSQASRR